MLATVLRRCFWDVYDHLGRLIVAHLLWLLLVSPFLLGAAWSGLAALEAQHILLLAGAWSLFFASLLVGPATLGFLAWFLGLVQAEEPAIREIWVGFRRFFWQGCALVALLVLVNLGLFTGAAVYATQFSLPRGVAALLLGLFFWAALLFWGTVNYLPVLLVHRALRGRDAWKQAFLLLLDNPGLTLGVSLSSLLVIALSLLSGVGLLLLSISVVSGLHWHALCVLTEKYQVVEQLTQQGHAPTRRSVRQRLHELWADEPRRGWREILKPWDHK